MTKKIESSPGIDDYLAAANEAYTQPFVTTSTSSSYPFGLTVLESSIDGQIVPVYSYIPQDGFYAVAFETPKNQVIVSFEGTNFFTGNATFTASQVVDDADIVAGKLAPSFTDAVNFTNQALQAASADGISSAKIFLDGHSLGAADAEYVAAQTGMAGTTFGTPGISNSFFKIPNSASNLTNYVEYGDPVGNYANTPQSPIQDIVKSISPRTKHYGKTIYVGDHNDYYYLEPTYYYFLKHAGIDYAKGTKEGLAEAAGDLTLALGAHSLKRYAKDIPGGSLGGKDDSSDAGFSILGLDGTSAAETTAAEADAPLACFVEGTAIRTTRGDVPVEALAIGDVVVTSSGALRPIRWLGHRKVECRRRDPSAAWPVRIAKDALGPGAPARDLLVSPGHAVCLDLMGELLIPAGALVDGASIAQIEVDTVVYWHVELDGHDVIIAEGLPCESYLEMGNRGFFAKADIVALYAGPDASGSARTHDAFCRPFHDSGAIVAAVRRRLAVRSATRGHATGASRAA